MPEKMYLYLLILGGILFQGILGSFLDDDHKNASNLHLRTKRMVPGQILPGHSMVPGYTSRGHGEWMYAGTIHIVKIFKGDEKICTGVIATPHHIIAPRGCASYPRADYRIESGAEGKGPIETHRIEHILDHKFLHLLPIAPPITFEGRFNRPIRPAAEALPGGIPPIIIAWEYTGRVRPIMQVELVNWASCAVRYQNHQSKYPVTSLNICAVASNEEQSLCLPEDRGSALVVGDRIFAVLARAGKANEALPHVFVLVNNGNSYYNWLMDYVRPYLHNLPQLYN